MYRVVWVFCLVGFLHGAAAESLAPVNQTSFADVSIQPLVSNIRIEGSLQQQQRTERWLRQIAQIPVGFSTLAAIHRSHHQLTIKHSPSARLSAGRTVAPMTNDLINGVGADVTILWDMDMSDEGTHHVYDAGNQLIEFTAIQNLYHELAHAMHQMRGTWRYFASERQAIEAENDFRYQLALHEGKTPRLRYRTAGVPIDFSSPVTAAASFR